MRKTLMIVLMLVVAPLCSARAADVVIPAHPVTQAADARRLPLDCDPWWCTEAAAWTARALYETDEGIRQKSCDEWERWRATHECSATTPGAELSIYPPPHGS